MNKKLFILFAFALIGILGVVNAGAPFTNGTVSFYPFQNTSGSVFDLTGTNPGTISGTVTRGVTGIYQNGFNFGGGYVDLGGGSSLNLNPSTNDISICAWIKTTSSALMMIVGKDGGTSSTNQYQFFMNSGNVRATYGGSSSSTISTSTYNDSAWHFACMTGVHGGGEVKLYVDGSPTGTPVTSGTSTYSGDAVIGNRPASSLPFSGNIDEVQIYNYTLTQTQIDYLYNSGSPGPVQQYPFVANNINLNSPSNNAYLNSNSVTFNWTIANYTGIVNNVSLLVNGTQQYFSNSGNLSGTHTFTNSSMPDGTYNWEIAGYIDGTQINSSTNTFTIDTQPPTINITNPYPNNTLIDYQIANTNLQFNWTVSDAHLSTCWVEYGGTNHTVTCSTNTTNINITSPSVNNATFYANDTAGNLASKYWKWGYKVFQKGIGYVTPTLGGASNSFTSNITLNSAYQLLTPYLVYNGTSYSASFTKSGSDYHISKSLTIPFVSSSTNVSFYWNYSLSDGSFQSTSDYNQTINNLALDTCGSYTNKLFTFTIYDEENPSTKLTNTSVDYAFNLYNPDQSALLLNLSGTTTSNPFSICANNALNNQTTYSLKYALKQSANSSFLSARYYNDLNFTLTNSTVPKNISLYNILSANSIPFQLTFRDSQLALDPNIMVHVERQYVSSNDYKTVEIPVTDSNGQAVLNLVRNNVLYTFIMTDAVGNIIATFNRVTAFCQDYTIGSCSIALNAPLSNTGTYNYTSDSGISYTTDYSNTTKLVTVSFNSINSTSHTVMIKGTTEDQFGNRTVCSDSLATTTGVLTCNVSSIYSSDDFLFLNVYSDGNLIGSNVISLHGNAYGGSFGTDGYFLAFFLLLGIITMFMDDRQTLVIMLGVGWLAVIGLGLIKGSILGAASGGIWLIVTIVIFVWKLKNEEAGGGF